MKESRKKPTQEDAPNDVALIRSFLDGEKNAFNKLVMRHQDRVFNLCYRFFGDYHEANDMAQEIFIKVYRSLETFRFQSGFSTWLYRIAVNTCRNRSKSLDYRLKKMMRSFNGKNNPEKDETEQEIPDETASPIRKLEEKEIAVQVQKAIHALTGDKKTVVILRDIQGLSYEEIAGITGFSLGTVKSKLSRARLELRKKLERFLK
jgi:RNA polymerase sigma-70 factor (ECF subfamily)